MNDLIPSDKLERISEALYSNRKIEAVKLYRQATQAGLADAKREVDRLEAELRSASPERFLPRARSRNTIILILAVHCVMVASLTVASASSAIRLAHGETLSSFRNWLPWVGLACSVLGAASAFRAQWRNLRIS